MLHPWGLRLRLMACKAWRLTCRRLPLRTLEEEEKAKVNIDIEFRTELGGYLQRLKRSSVSPRGTGAALCEVRLASWSFEDQAPEDIVLSGCGYSN